MRLKKLLIIIFIVSIIMIPGYIYAENSIVNGNQESYSTANGNQESYSIDNGNQTSSGEMTEEEKEEYLKKEIEYTEFIEVEKGMTIKGFIELEKQKILKGYSDELEDGWQVEFGDSKVYEIKGTTNEDLKKSRENGPLLETDIVRTNMVIEIDTHLYKIVDGQRIPGIGVGEGSIVATVVKGDIAGTGDIDVTDLSLMQEQIVGTKKLKGPYQEAADLNNDKSIDVVDLSEIQQEIINN